MIGRALGYVKICCFVMSFFSILKLSVVDGNSSSVLAIVLREMDQKRTIFSNGILTTILNHLSFYWKLFRHFKANEVMV